MLTEYDNPSSTQLSNKWPAVSLGPAFLYPTHPDSLNITHNELTSFIFKSFEKK